MDRTLFESLKLICQKCGVHLFFFVHLFSRLYRHMLQQIHIISADHSSVSTQQSIFPTPKNLNHPTEHLVDNYVSLLAQKKFKKLTRYYERSLLNGSQFNPRTKDLLQNPADNPMDNQIIDGTVDLMEDQNKKQEKHKTVMRLLSGLYASCTYHVITDYEFLLQYKLPFSELGVDRFLIYTKLTTTQGDRYMVFWIQRNIYCESAWKIENLYLHNPNEFVALDLKGLRPSNLHFYTICGDLIDDSVLTTLFFVRLLTDSGDVTYVANDLVDAKHCHMKLMDSIQLQLNELFAASDLESKLQYLKVLNPSLQKKIEDFREHHHQTKNRPHAEYTDYEAYQILGLYQLPVHFKGQTRILVHLYVPSTQKYFSIWFTRSLQQGLAWKISDFYIHQFGNVKSLAYSDQMYCMSMFKTFQNRVFYMPDLVGKYILDSLFPLSEIEHTITLEQCG